MINALIFFESSTFDKVVKDKADYDKEVVGGTVATNAQKKAGKVLAIVPGLSFLGSMHAEATIDSEKSKMLDILIEPEILANLSSELPGAVCAGAWNPDGSQYGTILSYDHDGNEIITGVPIYPIHPNLLDFMPDDVVYDEKGLEVSRTRPTKLKQVHKYLGWADRRWT